MNYKVCILAAGIGSRMGGFSEYLNKVLIPLKGKPTICHIIEKFSEEIEIVIALGYKKESLKIFLKTAYPNRNLTFVNVDPYQGEGSGPGFSLLSCRDHLMCPFIHIAGDTLVREDIAEPSSNWLGVSEVSDTERFCSAKTEGDRVIRLDDKQKTDNRFAYIGLIGVYDYEAFWNTLEDEKNPISGEIQVSSGIKALLDKDLRSKKFTWFDTGTWESYAHATKNYPNREGYKGD